MLYFLFKKRKLKDGTEVNKSLLRGKEKSRQGLQVRASRVHRAARTHSGNHTEPGFGGCGWPFIVQRNFKTLERDIISRKIEDN